MTEPTTEPQPDPNPVPQSFPLPMPPGAVPADAVDRPIMTIDAKSFEALSAMRARVSHCESNYNDAKAEAKDAKEAFDGARTMFENEFDRFTRRAKGEDLPLFHQGDLIDQANTDPVVRGLVELLVDCGFDDINALVVNGWTEDERNEARAYLEALKANNEQTLDDPNPQPDVPPRPEFLGGDVSATMDSDTLRGIEAEMAKRGVPGNFIDPDDNVVQRAADLASGKKPGPKKGKKRR